MTLTASPTLSPAEYNPVATANAIVNWSQLEQNLSPSPSLSSIEDQVGRKQNQFLVPRKSPMLSNDLQQAPQKKEECLSSMPCGLSGAASPGEADEMQNTATETMPTNLQ